MSPGPARVVLLPSLRDDRHLASVIAEIGPTGPVALVTAGWQEWEEDDHGLRTAVGASVDCVNLRLYGRSERVAREDPELADGHQELQRRVRLLRRVYNLRLAKAMEAWIHLQDMDGDPEVLEAERESALDAVQRLDAHHRTRLRTLRTRFCDRFDPLMRGAVAR